MMHIICVSVTIAFDVDRLNIMAKTVYWKVIVRAPTQKKEVCKYIAMTSPLITDQNHNNNKKQCMRMNWSIENQ